MLRVIEYFTKSLKITQGRSKWHQWVITLYLWGGQHLLPFIWYSASNNGVTLKSGYSKWLSFYHFRDKAIYCMKIVIFSHPCIRHPVTGSCRNIAIKFGTEKLGEKVWGYDFSLLIDERDGQQGRQTPRAVATAQASHRAALTPCNWTDQVLLLLLLLL